MTACGGAAELGIGGKGGAGVSRKLNLGDNLDVTLFGIFYYLSCLFLSVEIGTVRLICVVAAVDGVDAPRVTACCAYCGELGVFVNLNAPTLVVDKVPMEAVHLVV